MWTNISQKHHTIARSWLSGKWFVITFFACLGLTLLLAWGQYHANHTSAENAVKEYAQRLEHDVLERITLYQYGLRGARGAILTSGADRITRKSFQIYSETRDIDTEFPGARGFGFIRRVEQANEADFVASARQDGWPAYAIRQFAPHDGERFAIQYIEPVERNIQAIGLDIASEANRRNAALAAIDTGKVQLTAPITLVQATGAPTQSFLILLAIYQHATIPETLAEKRQQAIGWSYAPLLMSEVLSDLPIKDESLLLAIKDVTDPTQPVSFYNSSSSQKSEWLYQQKNQQHVFGRTWEFDVAASSGFVAGLHQVKPEMILGVGVIASIVMGLLAMTLAANLQGRRAIDLERARTANIVDNTSDAIIGQGVDGNVIHWNKAAFELFGFEEKEALGQPLSILIIPDEMLERDRLIFPEVMKGNTVRINEATYRKKNNDSVEVSVTANAIKNEYGHVIGVAKIIHDISYHKTAERQLKEFNLSLEQQVVERTSELDSARNILRTVLDAVPLMIGYWDRNLINKVANQAYYDWFGLEAREMPGKTLPELLGSQQFAQEHQAVELVLAGMPQRLEQIMPKPDGSGDIHALVYYLPDREKGEVKGFYSVIHDVTELVENRLALADAIRENEALLSTINTQMLYSATDINGRIIDVNERFCEQTGYRRDELIGQDHRLLHSGEHDPAFWRQMWQQVLAGNAWHGEVCNRGKDERLHWFDTVIAPFHDSIGNIERLVALRTDISDRKAAESERHRVNLLLSNVLKAASEFAIIATDTQGNITIFNAGAERILHYPADEMLGQSPLKLFSHEQVNERAEKLSTLHKTSITGFDALTYRSKIETAERSDWNWYRRDGAVVQVSLVVTSIRDERRHIEGYLMVAQDIGRQKEFERNLMAAKHAAEQAANAKGQFLANMSHEIRTPMNAVLGMLQLVQQTHLNPRQSDYVGKAFSAAKSLLGVLNDILDFSKIDAGKLNLDPHPFRLEDLMRDLAVVLSGNVGSKPVELLYNIDARIPSEIVGDAMRMQQVLINLAGNAIKFTEKGHVLVQVAELMRDSDNIKIRFRIEDTGIGISKEQQAYIFDSFTQAEASTTRRFGGTGLGLVICKRLLSLMGSELCMDSTPGQGSCFWFDIQFPVSDKKPLVIWPDKNHPRVMIVDDSALVRELIVALGTDLGWRMQAAASGSDALTLLDAAFKQEPEDAFNVVLLDWQMPDIDGISVARQIRNSYADKAPTVVMLSAFGHQVFLDEQNKGHTPFDSFLLKPVTPAQLAAVVSASLNEDDRKPQSVIVPLSQRLQGMTLLVVEDNALNREVVEALLTAEGATVVLAHDGRAGVDIIRAARQDFDAVLMDMQMPIMDGLEATRLIRADGRFNSLPIIAMTANASASDRQQCQQAGMNDHVGKPFVFEQLISILLNTTCRQREGLPNDGSSGVDNSLGIDSSSSIENISGKSIELVLKRFGGKVGLYKRSLARFKSEGAELLNHLRQSLHDNNVSGCHIALHSLKGLSATLGAEALAAQAASLEALFKDKPVNPSDLHTLVNESHLNALQLLLNSQYDALSSTLNEWNDSRDVGNDVVQDMAVPIHELLMEISVLLEQRNLKVLSMLSNIRDHAEAKGPLYDALRQQIDALDFESALATARCLLSQ
ncbi:PAS domain S-box protein [Pectobacterium sp. LFLA-215]|uniref:CHASE domain-containing hybrid sensor histidine kinase/response regulator n=1 Tax=Pectobacterium sp. LFLA-215 TaxID=3419008 RepID=UPI003F5BEFF0